MLMRLKFHTYYLLFLIGIMSSCGKDEIDPGIQLPSINIQIDPASTIFLELNTVSGWVYLEEKPSVVVPQPSRGIIVYRYDLDTFLAYERTPPNDPNKCCGSQDQNCSKLEVGDNFPFVLDPCTGNKYQILDGSLVEGSGQFALIRYQTDYDGRLLYIFN